jgi:hypothetical protein
MMNMEIIFRFLKEFEGWFYFLAGIIAIYFLRQFIVSWRELQIAIFGLEKDVARRKMNTSLSVLILIGIFIAAEFIMVTVISVRYPNLMSLPTPTLEILQAAAVNTISPQTIPMISTSQPPLSSEGCIEDNFEWTYPRNGTQVNGTVELKGTVKINNLGFYKYDYKALGDLNWITIAGGDQSIEDDVLGGLWQTNNLIPGEYQLRLVAYDFENNPLPECVINITVISP